MLTGEQKIIYTRDSGSVLGEELLVLTSTNFSELPPGQQFYVRYRQPFVRPGDNLQILNPDQSKNIITSLVQIVGRVDNFLVFTTGNSKYRIEYKLIDIRRVLEDGPDKGVNSHRTDELKPFPI